MIIGITGGIGTGKSTVLKILAELGARTLSADDIAREVLAKGEPAYREVLAHFGSAVLAAGGQIDRQVLAGIIFADPEARHDLDTITHPRIIAKINRAIRAFRDEPGSESSVLVVEIPLLMECGMESIVDEVIVVAAEQETQIRRLTSRGGISRDEALRRIGSQMSMTDKVRRADRVIRNDSDMQSLRESVEAVWREILLLLHE
ncbi:MAG: dephospho-CoA kinase [Armatimonadota bacterium]|nr:dephospho-CoA kinase [bacterium]